MNTEKPIIDGRMAKTPQHLLDYQKLYYQANRQKILATLKKARDEAKARERQKHNTHLQFLQQWNKDLTERLKDTDLEDWLRWSLELTRDVNNKQINDIINGRMQNARQADKKNR